MKGVDLLDRRVVTRGIERPIGLDVRCRDGEHRFLPLATIRIGEEDVEVDSPLMLLETDQLDFYRSRGRAMRSTR